MADDFKRLQEALNSAQQDVRSLSKGLHLPNIEELSLADVARRVILVALFDNRTTLGMVRLKVKVTVDQLTRLFEDMFNRAGTEAPKLEGFAGKEAEDEIDKLFG